MPKEDISFPNFKYQELIETDWEDSDFKNILESKFFFVFYQFEKEKLILRKVKFWNMQHSDILEVKNVWEEMVKTLANGEIVKEVTDKGVRKTFFPKKISSPTEYVLLIYFPLLSNILNFDPLNTFPILPNFKVNFFHSR